ncbi:retropepsin-like aspartic protease [Paraflavitalea speifideaquila]|uniref:retropepsin-like aspartic protease n=1 Tax=Paraflavitalea speifideaquila TaxID=3076558 RepID=UPI0028E5FC70|nr:retropepsin-like aspartic protease [Paraflavitalea speifideiaquila]
MLYYIVRTPFYPGATKKPIVIPFTLTSEGHILVKATINGVEGDFIFDTGAGINMVTQKFADKLGSLQKTDGFYVGHRATGEAISTDLWVIKDLQMGAFACTGQKTAVAKVDFPLDGLISLMPFINSPITIDYSNKRLTIESNSSLQQLLPQSKIIPLQISYERETVVEIFTYVRLNNQITAQISLDCGAGFNVFRFNSRYMAPLGIDSLKAVKKYIKSPFDTTKGNTYYTTDLAELRTISNGTTANNIKATFIEGLIVEGITGMNWLGDQITIDIAHKRMLVRSKH